MNSIFDSITSVKSKHDEDLPSSSLQDQSVSILKEEGILNEQNITFTKSQKIKTNYSELIFGIHPAHTHDLGLKHYKFDPKEHSKKITKLKTLNDIQKEDYTEYKKITKKVAHLNLVQYIAVASAIHSNSIEEDWDLIKIVNEECPASWKEAFELGFKDLLAVNDVLIDEINAGKMICPEKANIFRAFELCPLNNVKVVILGQDPYHAIYQNKPVANGLSFSTNRDYKIQPSLRNIYKLLSKTIKGFEMPTHGDLTYWAEQGVLLMNTALTTVKHKAGAHTEFWDGFTTQIINVINKVKPECVYMLWGNHAIKMKKYIFHNEFVLEANHPSPMVRNSDFQKCDHFRRANTLLKASGQKEIDWCLPD